MDLGEHVARCAEGGRARGLRASPPTCTATAAVNCPLIIAVIEEFPGLVRLLSTSTTGLEKRARTLLARLFGESRKARDATAADRPARRREHHRWLRAGPVQPHEVFFGVSERDGLQEAAAWLIRNGIGWTWVTPAPQLPRPDRPRQRTPRPPGRTTCLPR
jgi:hypothetical protein